MRTLARVKNFDLSGSVLQIWSVANQASSSRPQSQESHPLKETLLPLNPFDSFPLTVA